METKKLRGDNLQASKLQSILSFQGKIYAFCENELHIEIEKQHDETLAIRPIHIKNDGIFSQKAVPINIHYVECDGEIFRVMLAKSISVSNIRRLDFSLMAWAEVKSLGDHALFVGSNTVVCCSAAQMGLNRGRLFYVGQEEKSLYELDMEDNCIKLTMTFSKLPTPWFTPEWIMIPRTVTDEKETFLLKFGEEEDHQINVRAVEALEQNNCRSKILQNSGLIDVIANSLHPLDYVHFRSTCKAVRWTIPATTRRLSYGRTRNATNLSPWLVFMTANGTIYNFLNPMHNNNEKYLISCSPLLAGAVIRFSKDGWLLMSKGKTTIFFYNPFTRQTVPLPDLPAHIQTCVPISFSALPTCRDCRIFAIFDRTRIYFIKHGDSKWRVQYGGPSLHSLTRAGAGQPHAPFFLKSVLLADLNEEGWEVARNFLQKHLSNAYASFLVLCGGNILLVHLGHPFGKSIGIYKLDYWNKDWVEVKSLGNYMLFVSTISSVSSTAPPNSNMKNKIYFPRLHGKGILYYSLETGKYHATGSEYASDDFCGSSEYLNASWIQPNWCPSSDEELDWFALI